MGSHASGLFFQTPTDAYSPVISSLAEERKRFRSPGPALTYLHDVSLSLPSESLSQGTALNLTEVTWFPCPGDRGRQMWPTDLLPLTFAELKKIRNFFMEVQILGLSGTTGRRVGSATPTAGWGPCRGRAGPVLVSPRPASPPGPLGVWLPLLASTPRPSALGERAPGLGPAQRGALGRGPHRVAQRCGLHLSGNPQLSTALRAGTVHTLSSGARSPLSSKRCPVQEGAALGSCGLAALPLSSGPLGRRGERGAVGEDRVRSRLPRVRWPVPPPGLCLVPAATSLNAAPPHTFP